MESNEPTAVTSRFLQAFSAADFDGMRSMLADDVRAYITNSEGGIDEVRGREEYLRRIEAMDLPAADFSVEPTQAPVPVDSDRALVMVEVRAGRGQRPAQLRCAPAASRRRADHRMADGGREARRERPVLVLGKAPGARSATPSPARPRASTAAGSVAAPRAASAASARSARRGRRLRGLDCHLDVGGEDRDQHPEQPPAPDRGVLAGSTASPPAISA